MKKKVWMWVAVIVVVILALWITVFQSKEPTPKKVITSVNTNFLPTKTGTYTYEVTANNSKTSFQEVEEYTTVTKNEAIFKDESAQGGYENVLYEDKNGLYQNDFSSSINQKQLLQKELQTPGTKIISLPLQEGQTWTSGKTEGKGNLSLYVGYQGTILSTVQTVTTKAGTFRNVVEIQVAYSSGATSIFEYAPDVGLVKAKTTNATTILTKIQKS